MGSSESTESGKTGSKQNKQDTNHNTKDPSNVTPWSVLKTVYEDGKQFTKDVVTKTTSTVGGAVESTVNKTIDIIKENPVSVIHDKYSKIKSGIDKLDHEVKKIKDLREYFFKGALVGSSLGLLLGFYLAKKTHQVSKVPLATLGTGISVGAVSACIPMAYQHPYFSLKNYYLSSIQSQDDESFPFWKEKYQKNFASENLEEKSE